MEFKSISPGLGLGLVQEELSVRQAYEELKIEIDELKRGLPNRWEFSSIGMHGSSKGDYFYKCANTGVVKEFDDILGEFDDILGNLKVHSTPPYTLVYESGLQLHVPEGDSPPVFRYPEES